MNGWVVFALQRELDGEIAMDTVKWNWMMDYCLKNRWPPSNSYFWRKAENDYFKQSTTL